MPLASLVMLRSVFCDHLDFDGMIIKSEIIGARLSRWDKVRLAFLSPELQGRDTSRVASEWVCWMSICFGRFFKPIVEI